MASATIYPTKINPKITSRCNSDSWVLNKNGCRDIQPLSRKTAWNSVCYDNDTVICWGEANPDAVDRNNPIYSSNFYNTITTYSGSFDTPTPFTTEGWQNVGNIPNSAKIKRIQVQYAWDQVKYVKGNNIVTWRGSGNKGSYQSSGGYFKTGPQISLRIGGKTLSVTGPGVRSSSNCTHKNSYSYASNELRICKAEITGFQGMTMSDFKKSFILFTPPKNYASDVTRIVMRYLRVYIEYEDIPPAFNIESISFDETSTTNCTGNIAKLTIKLKNNSVTNGTTQIKLSGTGIQNGKYGAVEQLGIDTIDRDKNNDIIWTLKTNVKTRTIIIPFTYSTYSTTPYVVNATVLTNKGTKTTASTKITVNSCQPNFNFEFLTNSNKTNNNFLYKEEDETTVKFRATLKKSASSNDNEKITIDLGGLKLKNNTSWTIENGNNVTYTYKNGIYTFDKVNQYTNIIITGSVILDKNGIYNIKSQYINNTQSKWNKTKTYNIVVESSYILPKDYFKLRLEDGSDVKYNSLMITKGDDLSTPLTYTSEEINNILPKMEIYGETKRIPVNETQYIKFNIKLEQNEVKKVINNREEVIEYEDVEFNNVLTYIDIYSEEYNANDIIVGAGKGVKILDSSNGYICSIDKISSKEDCVIKLAVKSSIEIDDVVVKIKPFNYDGYTDEIGWIPTHIMFKDIPNIKISIRGKGDITIDDDPYFELYYDIENLSDVIAKNVRFQLKEPNKFSKECYAFLDYNDCDDIIIDNDNSGAWFNKYNRILTFPVLEAHSGKYTLTVRYKATKKGIYNFIIHTLDDVNDLIDDQYENSYQHTVMVDIVSETKISTNVNNKIPHINELIDFNIKVKNLHKEQDEFYFEIYDIGSYDVTHNINDYSIAHKKLTSGVFTESNVSNKIGTWKINDIGINDENILTLSMRPQDTGNHVIKTVFKDSLGNVKEFYNKVTVIERDKQLKFDVYHAIDENGTGCEDCSQLTQICDDDFINLNDEIFYVFKVTNNSRNPIQDNIHIYARLPESFLTNKILCSSYNYLINQSNNLITFTIPSLAGCNSDKNNTFMFCIKIKPAEVGEFISNFTLSTRSSKVLYKQLKLTVDTEFTERKLEHEIDIYNFEKTNKNYRYEIDNVGEIFKFFNTGDKSLRPIEIENYNKKSVEHYKGSNLKKLVRDIRDNSQYVDPVFLRTGSNKLADKGYELFPDGLIRRFGLLNSEVYHYSGQFPIVTDLVDRAMKWDIDSWDTKVWAGGKYDNGIFDLTIDYDKVPSNFNILDTNNKIKNLQNLVDNVKPYGTQAICYYSASVELDLQIYIEDVKSTFNHDIKVQLYMPDDFSTISYYNRYDNTNSVYYDIYASLHAEIKKVCDSTSIKDNNNTIQSRIEEVDTCIYSDKISKQTVEECFDLISDAYNLNLQNKNIDISKPYIEPNREENNEENLLSDIQILNFDNVISDTDIIGFKITPFRKTQIYTKNRSITNNDNDNIYCIYTKDTNNDFEGFKLIYNNNTIQERNIIENVNNVSIQVQLCEYNSKNVLHFWGSVNKKDYYHIGFLIINDFNTPTINIENSQGYNCQSYIIDKENDTNISFKVSDKIKTINTNFTHIYPIENNKKWSYLKNINNGNNKYAYFENIENIDPECVSKKNNIPKLVLKYDNINIDDLDEIIDIKFKIDAQSNKTNFEKDININVFKNGDKYYPENNLAREIHYPKNITNINQEFLSTIDVEQDSITTCSNCLKTTLGYVDKCPYCESTHVYHSTNKIPATACHNCGWIIEGWNTLNIDYDMETIVANETYNKQPYCKHCLSYDVDEILIDYNKTYCNNCDTLSNNYYEHCPQCFSTDVVHLTDNINRYHIFDNNTQNIDPIDICINEERVKVFTLHIPFNYQTSELKELEYLYLKINGANKNDGKYYYCESCKSAGVGHYTKCPYCGSEVGSVHNYQINNNIIETYLKIGDEYTQVDVDNCNYGDFIASVDLLKCAELNKRDKFQLIYYISNQSYNQIIDNVTKLSKVGVDEEYQTEIIDSILPFNITINNLSLDYKYKQEYEWNINNLEGANHTGAVYKIPNNNSITESISFRNFDIEKGQYKHAYIYISGLLNNILEDNILMQLKITNDGKTYYKNIQITDILFNTYYDIIEKTGPYLNDTTVEVSFKNGNQYGEITIIDCNIITEKTQNTKELFEDLNTNYTEHIKDTQIFKSNNLWGLNDSSPGYLSGHQLMTNLIACIDFGKIELEEYIRVYDIDMIISYKNKLGHIITDTIDIGDFDSTREKLIESGINIDDDFSEEVLIGDIDSQNGALWGSINYPVNILNNLECESTNIDENDEILNAIPLRNKIAQSFNTGNEIGSISKVYINYAGRRGYPDDILTVYLCKNNGGQPGNIIATNTIQTSNLDEVLNINFDVYNLQKNTTYWIVIEDISADKNNYHKFYYNNNIDKGQLITYDKKQYTYESYVLSFAIDVAKRDKTYYKLPTTWLFDSDVDGYKIYNTFYRFNIQDNVSLSNMCIKGGYKIRDTEPDTIDEDMEANNDSTNE